MISRDPIDDRCYLGKECPGASCPYNMTRSRSPSGTVYITVPAVPHHLQVPGTVVYSNKPSSAFSAPVVHVPEYAPSPRREMVDTSTQTTPELLEQLLVIKQEPMDEDVSTKCSGCTCNCKVNRPNVVVFKDGKAISVAAS